MRGLFHWTAVDNYEWFHGFDVSFGIMDRDRRVRASAGVLAERGSAQSHAHGSAARPATTTPPNSRDQR